jgi:branched-chain amino acid transport system permease protein
MTSERGTPAQGDQRFRGRVTSRVGTTGFVSLVGLVVLALVPLFEKNAYTLSIFVIAFIWLVVVAGWDLITGYAGVFSFAQVAFFVIGAYASGMLAIRFSLSPWLTMPLAGLITAGVAVLIGIPCLRVKGVYVALVTYALQLVLPTFILNGSRLGTGGSAGLLGIPGLRIGSYVFSPLSQTPWYYTGLAIAAISVYLIYFRIVKSRFGMSMAALRDAEGFAKSLGVNESRTVLGVFAFSGFFTGLIGGFYGHYTGSVSQDLLGMNYFLLLLVMLTVGGMGRFPGAILGALLFTFANEYLRVSGSARMIIIGAIVIVAIVAMPHGLIPALESLVAKLRRRGKPAEPGEGDPGGGGDEDAVLSASNPRELARPQPSDSSATIT